MASFTMTEVIGNVGKDPEITTTTGGRSKASFSVAHTKKFKNAAGEPVERTTWFRCVAWGKIAEIVEKYVSKGNLVRVAGEMQNDKFTGRDGTEKDFWFLTVDQLLMMGGNRPSSSGNAPNSNHSVPSDSYSDDVPF
jgi:single-strand DNA-binding protein